LSWGIVSNIVSFRLYHGNTRHENTSFTLQDLQAAFEFYCLFERGGLLPSASTHRLVPMCY
jgi:hypothetical protein